MIASPLANVIGPSVTGFPVGLARLASSSSSSSSSSRGRFSAPTDFSASGGGGGGASSSSRAGVSSMDGGAVDGGAVASSVVASSALVIAKTETRARECDDRGSGLESQRSRRRRDGRERERERDGENDRDGTWDGTGKGGNEMEKIMSVVYKSSTRDGGGETGRRGDDGGHARRAGSAAYERARPESPRAASSGASMMAPVSSSRFGPGWRPV